jgi:hypothetical protein
MTVRAVFCLFLAFDGQPILEKNDIHISARSINLHVHSKQKKNKGSVPSQIKSYMMNCKMRWSSYLGPGAAILLFKFFYVWIATFANICIDDSSFPFKLSTLF